MQWTIQHVASALGLALPAGLDPMARVAGVSIDSRTLRAGELFIAIHGPRHDGHDFVAAALGRGAVAAVVARSRAGAYGEFGRGRLLAPEDPREALGVLARAMLRDWRSRGSQRQPRRLAAVTGSAGKTTTKEILAQLLAARFRVLKSEGNFNNEYGLPLTLLRLAEAHEAVVVELGMNHRGELAKLAAIAEPQVGVVTCVAPVHLEFFSSLDEIAFAKRELIEHLHGGDSLAVLNADDARVAEFADYAPGRAVTFGFAPHAHFRAENLAEHGVDGSEFDFVAPQGRARLRLPLAGRHNVINALAALAAASEWGLGADVAREVLAKLAPPAMRGEILRFAAGFTVINDSYNSNPAALASTVNLLAATPGAKRRVAVAGEMLELGPAAPELHRESGRHIAASGADWVIGVQGHAMEIVEGAKAAGHAESRARFFGSSEEAARFIVDFVEPGDVVLVKGSRGVRMERVIEVLRAKFPLAERKEA